MSTVRKFKLHMLLVIILATIIRLINLGEADLWRDEAFSVRVADQSLKATINTIKNDTAPPLHSLLLNIWIQLFGTSEASVRSLSLIFGVATVYVIYLLAKKFFRSKKWQFFTTIMATVNPLLVQYSQEARNYSMTIFFASIVLLVTIRLAKDKQTGKNWIALIVSSLFGLYTNNLFVFIVFTSIFVIFLANLEIQSFKKLQLKKIIRHNRYLIFSSIIILILYLPWFIVALKQSQLVSKEGFWLHLDPIKDMIKIWPQFFAGETNLESMDYILKIAFVILSSIGIAGLISTIRFKIKKANKPVNITILWIIIYLVIIWLYSFSTSFFYIRYLTFLVPAVLLVSLTGISRLAFKESLKYILIGLIITSSALLAFEKIEEIPNQKARMSYLTQELESKYQPDQDLILHTNAYTHHAFNVYSNLDNQIYNPDDHLPYFEGLAVIDDDAYYSSYDISSTKRVWVIYLWSQKNLVTKELEKNYTLVETRDYQGDLHLELWSENVSKH